MNRKRFGIMPIIAGIAVLLFALTGCQNIVSPGEEVVLRIGQSVSIEGEDLKITFAGVSGDSRCPADAICIWAGEVTCLMEIRQDGEVFSVEFVYPGLADGFSRLTHKNHTYNFKVRPYPEIDKTIADSEYRLILTVD